MQLEHWMLILLALGAINEWFRAEHHKKWHKHYAELAAQCEQELDHLSTE